MSEWTKSAKDAVEERLGSYAAKHASEGAEATEVVDDLRRHIDQEVDRLGIPIVTEEDALRIMAGIDPELMKTDRPVRAPEPPVPPVSYSGWATAALWLFCVFLPVGAIGLEWAGKMMAEGYVDPIPSWIHLVLLALVPISAAATLNHLGRKRTSVPVWLRWCLAVATGVALGYGILFIPLMPFAVMGILFFGIGLLPLSPVLALVSLLVLGRRCRARRQQSETVEPRFWIGSISALALLCVLALPGLLTAAWLDQSARGSSEEKNSAVRWLRRFGDEDELLRACYWRPRGFAEEVLDHKPVTPEEAQRTYYQVTGRAFNSVRPPLSSIRGAGRRELQDFVWDTGLGGEAVGGRVTGLSMASSRLDAMAHAGDGWGYVEWTMEFRNDHQFSQREARAVLQLPAGGTVSRVTLWVNGEEREAAFAGRAQARQAYQNVAVQQRRDPILVTTAGPDRVLMQCFPVQPRGGVMRVRLGITVPLEALAEDRVAFVWPAIAEQNFSTEENLKHHAWLEIPDGALENDAGWPLDAARPNSVHSTFSNRAIAGRVAPVFLRRTPPKEASWAKDDRSTPPGWVGRHLEKTAGRPASRVALVFDGGPGGQAAFEAARRAFAAKEGGGEFAVWMVKDGERRLPESGSFKSRSEVAQALEVWSEPFSGGHDPLPALEAAWDWAGGTPDGVVLWIHGAQPLVLGNSAGIAQRLDRAITKSPVILNVMDLPMPDRLAEMLTQNGHVKAMVRLGTLDDDLVRLFGRLEGSESGLSWTLERSSVEPPTATASRHLVRLWAREESGRLAAARKTPDAVALASRWQLVTPVSGAVVLETREQFKAQGLEAVDSLTTPGVVPEPETWALLVVGSVVVLWLHVRQRKSRPSTVSQHG